MENKKYHIQTIILNFFLGIYFLFIPKFVYSQTNKFYVFNVEKYYFSRWCYSVKQCNLNNPPSGKTFENLIDNFDVLTFLVSFQGLVNRRKPMLLLIHSDLDKKWLDELYKKDLFPKNLQKENVVSLEQLLEKPLEDGIIKGSVIWDDKQPFTLNLAFSVAAADNLVVVRKGSNIYSEITSKFPVQLDLSDKFSSKEDAYKWLVDNYLNKGKLSPILFLVIDGWPVYKYKYLKKVFLSEEEIENWNLLGRDYGLSKKAMFFDLGVHPNMKDPIENKVGADYQTSEYILNVVKNRVGSNFFESWGWPSRKYMIYGCGGGDDVSCGEWYWVQRISQKGGVQRFGGIEFYATEPSNLSFYQHFRQYPQLPFNPAPMKIEEMFKKEYLLGYPIDFSFELDGKNWIFNTTNRKIYNEPQNSSHGNKFLQVNVSPSDVGKSIYQDFRIPLKFGYRYRFIAHFKSPEGVMLKGRQVVWAWPDNGNSKVLCHKQFEKNNRLYEPLICEFDVKENNLTNVRIEIYIDTPNHNYSFDEFYFMGPNSYILNKSKKFLLFYQGDDDMSSVPYIIRIGVYPYTWYDSSSSLKTCFGFTGELAERFPLIWNYFVKTKDSKQTWCMPDTGVGYVNTIVMPDSNLNSFIKDTVITQRKFQYSTGWVLEGFNSHKVPYSQKVFEFSKKVAPEGIFYNSSLDGKRVVKDGIAMVPMIDFSYGGDNVESQAIKLREFVDQLNNYNPKFLVLRNIFVSDGHLEKIVKRAKELGADFEVLDPKSFFYLYKLAFNSDDTPTHRFSVIKENIPHLIIKNESYSVDLTIRNDGWSIWTQSGVSTIPGRGGYYNLAYGFLEKTKFFPSGKGVHPDFPYDYRVKINKTVLPGETINLSFNLKASQKEGEYILQFDGVKEYFEFFEKNGNVPWIKEVKVISVPWLFTSYGEINYKKDLNYDYKINSLDFGVMIINKFNK